MLAGTEEVWVGLLEGVRDTLGDADRLGVVSQSIRLKMVSYVRT